jgi:hypothetical protein
MSVSRSVIVCEVSGGSMRLKTFQAREYCGAREKSFLEQLCNRTRAAHLDGVWYW